MNLRARPLLFTPENFKLVLDDVKTQTRRVVQSRHEIFHPDSIVFGRGCRQLWDKRDRCWIIGDVEAYIQNKINGENYDHAYSGCWYENLRDLRHPYGMTGDLFYLTEPTQVLEIERHCSPLATSHLVRVRWLYDGSTDVVSITQADLEKPEQRKDWRKPCAARFMLKSFARCWVQQESVWVERLPQISWQDALAEGICPPKLVSDAQQGEGICFYDYQKQAYSTEHLNSSSDMCFAVAAINSYRSLWDSINASTHPWTENQFVYALQFRRVADRSTLKRAFDLSDAEAASLPFRQAPICKSGEYAHARLC